MKWLEGKSLKMPPHGSNPKQLFAALGLERNENLVDFSVNLNPLGAPSVIGQQWTELVNEIADYPDPHCTQLREQMAENHDLSPDQVLIGNGAAELIHLLARLFSGDRVLVVDPAFSEYRTTCRAYGCEADSFLLCEENGWQIQARPLLKQLQGKRALFLCHPNNPTGVAYKRSELEEIIYEAGKMDVIVIVDEAFYDFCDESISVLPFISKYKNLVVLRSFTKMFAVAGLRLGCLITDEPVIKKLKAFQPHWSVNSVAQKVGELCLRETGHRKKTVRYITKERQRIVTALQKLRFVISPSRVNYFLLREETKQPLDALMSFLLQNGIVPRHTHNFIGLNGTYLRLAVRTETENDLLIDALGQWRAQCLSL
jgi:threonine-phosphate decarboxylase